MTLSFEHTELLYNMPINLSRESVCVCVCVSVGTVRWGDMMDLNLFSSTMSGNHDEVGQSQPLQHMHIEHRRSRALL